MIWLGICNVGINWDLAVNNAEVIRKYQLYFTQHYGTDVAKELQSLSTQFWQYVTDSTKV